jgi:hypothetical protein
MIERDNDSTGILNHQFSIEYNQEPEPKLPRLQFALSKRTPDFDYIELLLKSGVSVADYPTGIKLPLDVLLENWSGEYLQENTRIDRYKEIWDALDTPRKAALLKCANLLLFYGAALGRNLPATLQAMPVDTQYCCMFYTGPKGIRALYPNAIHTLEKLSKQDMCINLPYKSLLNCVHALIGKGSIVDKMGLVNLHNYIQRQLPSQYGGMSLVNSVLKTMRSYGKQEYTQFLDDFIQLNNLIFEVKKCLSPQSRLILGKKTVDPDTHELRIDYRYLSDSILEEGEFNCSKEQHQKSILLLRNNVDNKFKKTGDLVIRMISSNSDRLQIKYSVMAWQEAFFILNKYSENSESIFNQLPLHIRRAAMQIYSSPNKHLRSIISLKDIYNSHLVQCISINNQIKIRKPTYSITFKLNMAILILIVLIWLTCFIPLYKISTGPCTGYFHWDPDGQHHHNRTQKLILNDSIHENNVSYSRNQTNQDTTSGIVSCKCLNYISFALLGIATANIGALFSFDIKQIYLTNEDRRTIRSMIDIAYEDISPEIISKIKPPKTYKDVENVLANLLNHLLTRIDSLEKMPPSQVGFDIAKSYSSRRDSQIPDGRNDRKLLRSYYKTHSFWGKTAHVENKNEPLLESEHEIVNMNTSANYDDL